MRLLVAKRSPRSTLRVWNQAVGLLGRDYPGYFPVGGTAKLVRLLRRIETDAKFLQRLQRAVARRAYLFRPVREKAAWRALIAEGLHSRSPA